MPLALLVGAGFVLALVVRRTREPAERRSVLLVAAVALVLRVSTAIAIHLLADDSNGNGVWLNDEASFFLATRSLVPDPWNQFLPQGLDHLAGSSYLGLTTAISLLVGVDALAFRL